MKEIKNYLYEKKENLLQMPYQEYEELIKEAAEAAKIKTKTRDVFDQLLHALNQIKSAEPFKVPEKGSAMEDPLEKLLAGGAAPKKVAEQSGEVKPAPKPETKPEPEAKPEPKPESKPEPKPEPVKKEEPAPKPKAAAAPKKPLSSAKNVPSIKKDISDHFKKVDSTGKLFACFKQYYAQLNDACGGTVRVTIKDGICSIWNYDEWEEFAFVDFFEEGLRIAVNPHYADRLKSLESCEVSRLLARRHNLVCVKTKEMDPTILDVLITAFNEIGAIA